MTKKYKLKMKYTPEELKELKVMINSRVSTIRILVDCIAKDYSYHALHSKYLNFPSSDDFDFMADIYNVVMDQVEWPEKQYRVHDKVTDQYIRIEHHQTWWSFNPPNYLRTKQQWLEINPAYEPMLEEVEDNKVEEENE
ncbi:hypothetical protein [Companilactobacillus mishanensis]|uniref:hypothetical protein n=1 Tax=Companilactobacillus mishanensis TaxID=2486008 RepID=UPI001297F0AB|nr:hypothetical protein [Companilactobacillus mishanensis]MQS88270.1 hypothetical protein [Companilactobacillus mishanensis]